MTAVLDLTEATTLTALRSFLIGALPTGIEVIRGEVNQVPEPLSPNYLVMWPLRQERLGTNEVDTYDNVLTASIAGTVLTVTAIPQQEAPLSPGTLLLARGNVVPVGTLGAQLSGSAGGTGTYAVAPSQTLSSGTLYAGVRADRAQTELTIQLDVHGPLSGDNVRVIEALFRSEYATDSFTGAGVNVTPLYCEAPRQAPFINDQQQYEYRWSIDAHLQVNPVVSTGQQFADVLTPTLIEVDAAYPP